MKIENKLKELGIELFPGIKPIGSYVPFVQSGSLIYISGQGPSIMGEYTRYFGKVGEDITKEEAKEAAAVTAVNLVSILKDDVWDLDRVKRIVSVHAGLYGAALRYKRSFGPSRRAVWRKGPALKMRDVCQLASA